MVHSVTRRRRIATGAIDILQHPGLQQGVGRAAHERFGQARYRGHVIQPVRAVGLVQKPQQRILEIGRILAAGAAKQAAFAQPRLAQWKPAAQATIAVDAGDDPRQRAN